MKYIIVKYSRKLRLVEHDIPKPNIENKATGSIFMNKSKELLQTIYDGVIHLEEVNKNTNTCVKVEYDSNQSSKISISIDQLGTFEISIDRTNNEIHLFSPVSYGQVYVYFENENEWKSVLDGHNIIQLLAIEINSHCQGYPRF